MSAFSVSLLGPFEATLDGSKLPHLRTNKAQALLSYLVTERVLSPGAVPRRESLMALLWPGMPENSARQNLRQALYLLRHAVPEVDGPDGAGSRVPFLLGDYQSVHINPQARYELDLATFLELIHEGEPEMLESAAGLYRGEFLADLYLDDSSEFEEWAGARRATFRRLALDGLEALTAHRLAQGEFERAEQCARRQIEIEPLHEEGHRQLIEVLARTGRRSAALAAYDELAELLKRELDVPPAVATQQLIAQVRAGTLQAAPHAGGRARGYKLQEEIGQGSFGVVYRAIQPAVGREVAVKAIRRRYANDPDFIRRFDAEAQLIARLEHPHIVPLYDYWREPGGAYLVMRWMRGGSLKQALAGGAWSLEQTVRLLEDVAPALESAHQRGIVHLDIKPANILLDEAGRAYLTDFGIAREWRSERRTDAGYAAGSPHYMAPEMLTGRELSPQSDLYSLGLVLYEMLAGQRIYADTPTGMVLVKRLSEPLPALSEARPDLPGAVTEVIQRATAEHPAERFADAAALALAFREAVNGRLATLTPPSIRPAANEPRRETPNPYLGLRPFNEADADRFFGREALTEELVRALRESRFLAVVGPSGSGKSSVVRAGLLPALRGGAIPGSEEWFITDMTPGDHPFEELEAALLRLAVNPPATLLTQLQEDERGLLRAANRTLPSQCGHLLLLVDQFEELYTLMRDNDQRRLFLDSLQAAVQDNADRVRVVLTLRADFYDRPLSSRGFGELVRDHTVAIVPPTETELARAIRLPAEAVGVCVDEALLTRLVADIYEQPGALPLLQYALTEMFERRERQTLTIGDYELIGGISGALANRAEGLYGELDEAQQQTTRQLFLRLVTVGEGAEDTRRRVPRSELVLPESGEPGAAAFAMPDIIDRFGRHRLLTFDHDPATREPTVEVAHEALLTAWPRLHGWIESSRDNLRQQRRLSRWAREWEQGERAAGLLLRGARLDQFAGWSQSTDLALSESERVYLDVSLAKRAERRAEEESRAAHEQALERRSRRFLRALAVVFAAAAVIALVLSILAFRERRAALEAYSMSVAANAQRALDERDTATALALALAANQIEDPPVQSQQTLMNAAYAPGPRKLYWVEELFPGVTGPATALAISPTGNEILLGFADGSVIMWRPETEEEVFRLEGHSGAVNAIAISEDGERAITGGNDAQVILWDLQTGREIHRLAGHSGAVKTVDFSPDGSQVLSGGLSGDSVENPGELFLWDAETALPIRRFQGIPKAVMAAALALGGNAIIAGSGDPDYVTSAGSASSGGALTYQHMWNTETGAAMDGLAELGIDIFSLDVSRDGSSALVGSYYDGTVTHWDVTNGEAIGVLAGHGNGVSTVAFSSDGSRALSGSFDRSLALWDLVSGELIYRFSAHGDEVLAAGLSSDGRLAYSSARDGSFIVWDLFDGMEVRRFLGHGDMVYDVGFSSDGTRAISSSGTDNPGRESFDSSIRLWDVQTGRQLLVVPEQVPVVFQVAFAPGDRFALATGSASNVWLIDLETGAAESFRAHKAWGAISGEQPDTPQMVASLDIDHDHALALTGSVNGMMALWDLADLLTGGPVSLPPPLRLGKQLEGPWAVAISPDGRTALAQGGPGSMIWWDLETGAELRSFTAVDNVPNNTGATGIAFLPDGKNALTVTSSGYIIQWDLESGEEIRRLGQHNGIRGRVEVSPDGRYALTCGWDGELAYWDLQSGELIRRFGRPGITYDIDMSPDGRYALTGSSDRSVTMWDLQIRSASEMFDWIGANRFVRELSCEEQELYGIETTCE